MTHFPCPYLNGDVELAEERQVHIAERHPDLLPAHFEQLGETLAKPDQVRRSERFGTARLFARWFEDVRGGKFVVVVVVNESSPTRNWIVTAYIARRLSGGTIEWTRN
ncbi:hypothetical protein MNBD_CHLOROFLEXI01-2807 [hydrothermal vent metagenome]|uniref:Phage-Barnase-EndoU-ColicinE5/D-RelE like nuclease 2 domain-containing protein n=1 Tax=hydrothermal vent metagenome TaxID=652676 RepID=A0A3B0V362_9ZZZZ